MVRFRAVGLHRPVTVRPTPELISTFRSGYPEKSILLNDAHSGEGRNRSGGRAYLCLGSQCKLVIGTYRFVPAI